MERLRMKNKKLYISICVFTMILSFFIIKNGIIGDKVTAIAEGEYVVEYFDGVELHSNNFQTRSDTDGELNLITGSVYSL